MKLYIKDPNKKYTPSEVPQWAISIDPGQSTMGVYCRNMETGKDYLFSICSKGNPMGVAMGKISADTYDRVLSVWQKLLSIMGEPKSTVLIVEQTTTNFQFSAGIIACVQCWTDLVLSAFPKSIVIYLSNRITNYMTRKVKITGSDSKKVVLSQFPDWKEKIDKVGTRSGVYSHVCDAILMNWGVYYSEWGFKDLRKPKNEIIYL